MNSWEKQMYPPIEPYASGFLKVSHIHELYYEECGNPQGLPIVYLHGGPGGGISKDDRRYFDPKAFRIVLFDQRGAGKSLPCACLEENDTWSMVQDIEKLRQHLQVDKWVVFGGSWGSTLALSYAIKHSESIKALILRGIFMLRKSEVDWLYQKGASHLFPDYWEGYMNPIPKEEQHDFISAYYKRLCGTDKKMQLECAKAWSKWECATSKLLVDPDMIAKVDNDTWALQFARIECHYFINKGFFDSDEFILENVDKFKHIPGVIVQGRYDVVCPMQSAWDLHKKWGCELKVIPDCGHSAKEAGIRQELIRYCDYFRDYFNGTNTN